MAGERYEHLFIDGFESTRDFTNPRRGRDSREFPPRNRQEHAAYLRGQLDDAWRQADAATPAVVESTRKGAYIEFAGKPGSPLKFESLEYRPSGIRLCNVHEEVRNNQVCTLATVYVPNDKRNFFLKRLEAYAASAEADKAKNEPLINSISSIRYAVLESFWRVDERDQIPGDHPEWVEVWLRTDSQEEVEALREMFISLGIESLGETLTFPERSVILTRATGEQLGALIQSSELVAEFRAARQVATYYVELENRDQAAEVQALLGRVRLDGDSGVAVCVLDGGVNRGHPLLLSLLDVNDLHAYDPAWGTHDHDGHGTLMAGTAAFGDLLELLGGTRPIHMRHRLESAKILPPPPEVNPKRLWGQVTSQGVSRAEIQAPYRKRVVCLAVTSNEDRDRGRPSSWSAALDALASGYGEETKRIVIVSAGNVDDSDSWRNYPDDNLTNEVHDPGQAWNVLTVGAYTEKIRIADPTLAAYTPIANAGSLSPYSTTSTTWDRRRWPIKPDVVFEGGNVARGPNDSIFDTDDLKLLSTSHEPQVAQFVPFCATSAAAAQAAWMAAQIYAAYPQAWPETVRGLIVHSARWTDMMRSQFMRGPSEKKQVEFMLRVCGYGVPGLERALYSLADSLTLIAQSELQPFDKRESVRNGKKETSFVTKDMHLYRLPWPADELSALGEHPVIMRVTLSYFVEPGPGEVGWDHRYRYASHALRFKLNGPLESEAEFVRRVNTQAREEGEGHPGTVGPADKWLIGDARDVGSIHSDVWSGTASELAASNLIAVYPTVGWWRERTHLNRWDSRCRYSLIVSIETPELEQEINIYIPVAAQVGIPIPIPISDGV